MTIGADDVAAAHHLVEAQRRGGPARRSRASRCAPAGPGTRPARRPGGSSGPGRRRRGTPRARRGRWRRCRPGRRTGRPSGTGPCPRRTAGGCTPAGSRGRRTPGRTRRARPRPAGCCRSRTPRRPCRGTRPSPRSARPSTPGPGGSAASGSVRAISAAASGVTSTGTYDSGSWALVWSVTMSAGKSSSSSRGSTSAALPTTPTDSARRSSRAARAAGDGVVEAVGQLVEVAGLEAPLDAGAVDVDAQRDAVVHRDRQRLGAAHPAEAGGQRDRAGERAAEAAAGDLGEALVGALEDALGADVDPRAGRHLAVHRQPGRLEPAELVPRRPVGHEVGVGDQHPRRPLVGAEHADRLARLDEHRLVVAERAQRPAPWRRTPPTTGRPGRCRRRRRGRRDARRPPGRGCSGASGRRPPAAIPGSSGRCRGVLGRDGRRRSPAHCSTPARPRRPAATIMRR